MRVSRSVRRTFALILPIALGGAEPAGPQPAAELPPLEAARRDLESAKGTRLPKQGGAALGELQLAVPSFPAPGAPAAQPSPPAPEKRALAPQPTRNWLVEAMERKGDGRRGESPRREGGPGGAFRQGSREEVSPSDERGLEERDGRREDAREEEPSSRARREEDLNPFSRYLQSWVSPQDYALLQATLASGRSAAAERSGESSRAPDAPLPQMPGAPASDGSLTSLLAATGGVPAAGSRSTKPADNPFLQFISPEPAPGRAVAPTPAPPPVSSFIPPPSTPVPAAASRGALPEFVRPTNDDKFFKQLKRF